MRTIVLLAALLVSSAASAEDQLNNLWDAATKIVLDKFGNHVFGPICPTARTFLAQQYPNALSSKTSANPFTTN
jgi:hypothetical protein